MIYPAWHLLNFYSCTWRACIVPLAYSKELTTLFYISLCLTKEILFTRFELININLPESHCFQLDQSHLSLLKWKS